MQSLHLTLALAAVGPTAPLALGVHRSTLHRWATGASAPREEQWERLARILQVDVGVLRYGPTPVLRSLLPKPTATKAEVVAMTGTVSEVARRTGLHRATVARWRGGR